MTEFYLNNKRYLDLYWSNSIPKETLTGKEVGEFWFRCTKCGKEWVLYSLDTLPYLKGCNCKGTTKETAYNERDLLKKFWDYERNTLDVGTIPLRSGKKIALRCPKCSGRWGDYDVADVTFRGKGCPYCSGRRVLKGSNDLLSQHLEVVKKYWDYGKNTVKPDEVYKLSGLKVFWKCRDCNYSWESSVGNFVRGTKKCPKCKGIGVNDLKSLYPELVDKFWDYEKNSVSPLEVTIGSKKPIYCRCKVCGGEWVDTPKILRGRKGCPYCLGRRVLKGFNDFKSQKPNLVKEWIDKDIKPENVTTHVDTKVLWECDTCNSTWYARVNDRTRLDSPSGCPQCAKNSLPVKSKQETEIEDFLKQNYKGTIETSKVGLLSNNLEIDIYIPEKKIGIEFNGVYWHSELYKDKNKHYTKHKLCKQMGITLFQIWEDQWRDRRLAVERLLLSKLGVLSQKKINARNCIIQEVGKMDAKPFMDENHIQGFVGASIYLGLFTRDGEMVALCQFLRTGKQGEFNLNRYATCESVRGGFTKLLKYFERVYLPKKVVTFSDNDYSDGGLYKNNGFVLEEVLEPDYYYTDSSFSNRVHKFNYRKERFKNDPNLYFEEGMTEKELAELNKLTRVWDSGKVRWVKYYN